ncbi:MAG: hypothetical protein R3F11_32710, partial [Verrucomicrobiales bacterium]
MQGDAAPVAIDIPGASWAKVAAVNAAGAVVGRYRDGSTGAYHGFIRTADGSIYPVAAPSAEGSDALALTDSASLAAVGWQKLPGKSFSEAVRWADEVRTNLDGYNLSGTPWINRRGDIVANLREGSAWAATAAYSLGADFAVPAPLTGLGGGALTATGLNDWPEVIGYHSLDGKHVPVIHRGGRAFDLNASAVGLAPRHATLYTPLHINGGGTILASGSAASRFRHFLLHPVADTDGDGMPDDYESAYGFDPFDPMLPPGAEPPADGAPPPTEHLDGYADDDGDGLPNREEFARGTHPHQPDSDRDGIPDGFEVENFLDPLDPADGAADFDGDGVRNSTEYALAYDGVDVKIGGRYAIYRVPGEISAISQLQNSGAAIAHEIIGSEIVMQNQNGVYYSAVVDGDGLWQGYGNTPPQVRSIDLQGSHFYPTHIAGDFT